MHSHSFGFVYIIILREKKINTNLVAMKRQKKMTLKAKDIKKCKYIYYIE